MTAQPEEQPSPLPFFEWELVVTLPGRMPIRIDRVSSPGKTKIHIPFLSQIDARQASQRLTLKVEKHVSKPE